MVETHIRDKELRDAMEAVAQEALSVICELHAKKHEFERYKDLKKVASFMNGLPRGETMKEDAPIDYNKIFFPGFLNFFVRMYRKDVDLPPEIHDLPSFPKLLAYVEKHDRLPSFLQYFSQALDGEIQRAVGRLVVEVVDRFLHFHMGEKLTDEIFDALYIPLEKGLFLKQLPFRLLVPIVNQTFEIDSVSLVDDVKIFRMPDWLQQSRLQGESPSIAQAATHAFDFGEYNLLENSNMHETERALSLKDTFSLTNIDKAFAIMWAFGIEAGYAQILSFPSGWNMGYRADLEPLYVASVDCYPTEFRQLFNAMDPPHVRTDSEIKRFTDGYNSLQTGSRAKFDTALPRLFSCYRRETEEDSILDAVIALECLLGDGNAEMTHKLSMRIAALSSQDDSLSMRVSEVNRAVKSIYAFRSSVVHGADKRDLDKKRLVSIEGQEPVPAVEAATSLASMVVRVMSSRPEYREPARIDEALLEGKLVPQVCAPDGTHTLSGGANGSDGG